MRNAPHVLVVDDDREIRDLLARFLRRHGYRIETAADGREMFSALGAGRFDLIVLDLMLPGEDGLSLCRRVRADSDLPIIMLTAVGEDTDRIVGLEVGADDSLPKPFNPRELLARIRAVLRRGRTSDPDRLAIDTLVVDCASRQVTRAGGAVELTGKEFDLLLHLTRQAGQVVSRDTLVREVWRETSRSSTLDNVIDVHISRLRRKIDADHPVKLIHTVRGVGFVLRPEAS